ncbi:hypothetical protein FRC15_009054 [Serendipita sp. 397]|nr:hypothetical protein FRC15_009054 [Serendipita sp. 397]KAG8797565.1 hypothetical protein FRC16_008735 [Serendipita sp. 398]
MYPLRLVSSMAPFLFSFCWTNVPLLFLFSFYSFSCIAIAYMPLPSPLDHNMRFPNSAPYGSEFSSVLITLYSLFFFFFWLRRLFVSWEFEASVSSIEEGVHE